MKIITFSGVDGSGKSTQLAKLRNYLESHGARVAYIHTVAFSLPQSAQSLFSRTTKTTTPQTANTRASFLGILLRKMILFIDLIRFNFFLKKLEREKVTYLLSDRYFYDTLVNIAYLDGTKLTSPFTHMAIRRIPKPTRAFYLRVTPEIIMERPRKPEQGLQYLKDKTLLFNEAAALLDFTTLDADRSVDEVFASIKQSL